MTDFSDSAELDVSHESGRVVLRTVDEATNIGVGVAFDPETACAVATDIVRQASAAGPVDVVSVFMPRADWELLATTLARGIEALDPELRAAPQRVARTVEAVLAYSPEDPDES